MRIGFIGFGEAARAFQESLAVSHSELDFFAFDILLDDRGAAPAMRAEMTRRGVQAAPPAALREADWIFSAVTADQSQVAVETMLPYLAPKQLFIDLNSVSPERKRISAASLASTGAMYLDMAVMAPVHPHGHRTPVLIAGAAAQPAEPVLARLGFQFRLVGDRPGQATAIKMVRSLFVKGLEAITVETLLAAQATGCFSEIVDSLSQSYPGFDLPNFAAYQFERTRRHGTRRAAEMSEVAMTVTELGLHGPLATAIAQVQAAMGRIDAVPDAPLFEQVEQILAKRLQAKEE
jgi:3-hydroxyisobutyrate dehydrogenase-like beta-hydroxyacid dehydrogenase